MEIVQVTQEIYAATRRLNNASKEVFRMAESKAQNEYTYRKALATKIVELRVDKMPVSIINDVARGEVSGLKLQRDLSDGAYRSALAAMEALKVEINALQTIAKYVADI